MYDDEDWSDWCESVGHLDVHRVRLNAPLATLEARESADPTRVLKGLARGMSARKTAGRSDVEIDTSLATAEEIARHIVGSLQRP